VYLKHFAFKRKPFTPLPDHRELFQSRGHQELRARLQLAIEDRDPSLVVGESGVGKTTSLRSVLATLDKRAYQLIELDEPRLKLRSFYGTLATGLGLAPTFFFGALAEQVRTALAQLSEKADKADRGDADHASHPVLVVDNAELLTEEMLDSLRLVTSPRLGQSKPGLTLLLVGDLSLTRRLKKPYFDSFVQRLRMTYRMPSPDEEEARRYVAHRIRTAGGNPDVFDPAAVEAAVAAANGRLRTIDALCSQALYAAFIAKANVVTKEHVQAVVAERSLGV
jgi:type II secretory pathway predicted ATPase ExeA